MTKDAQFALRRGNICFLLFLAFLFNLIIIYENLCIICFSVIEKYTKSNIFALICNNVNKIISALQARCTRFCFAPLDAVHVRERLKHVIESEG